MSDALSRAIAVCGGPEAFAAAVPVAMRTLADWRRFGVPDTRWGDVESATKGAVTAEELAAERASRLRSDA